MNGRERTAIAKRGLRLDRFVKAGVGEGVGREVRSGGTHLSSEQLRKGGWLAWATWGELVSKI